MPDAPAAPPLQAPGLQAPSLQAPGLQAPGLQALDVRELRTGAWTRLGDSAVLGDAVTEHTLAGLAVQAESAARAQGYATGWAEGRRAAAELAQELEQELLEEHQAMEQQREAEHRAAVAALQSATAQLGDALAAVCGRVEQQVVTLAVSLTEELVGHEVAVARAPGLDAVRRALALAPGEPVVRIRVSPDAAADPVLAELAGSASVVGDPSLHRGDAMVETVEGVIDARVSGALARVLEVLTP